MGHYGSPSSAALSWGKKMEPIARKHYIAYHRLMTNKHTGVQCTETGLWVSTEHPFIAASPDGIISCKQCGTGLSKVKNPFTHCKKTIRYLHGKMAPHRKRGSPLTTVTQSEAV